MQLKYILPVLLLLSNLITTAQTPEWEWARHIGSIYDDWVSDIATDANNNIYITVNIGDSITFDSINYITTPFIAKYSSSGDISWAQEVYYNPMQSPLSLINNGNNLFLAGNYNDDTLIYNNDTTTGHILYLSKYDLNGNLIWLKSAAKADLTPGYGNIQINKIANDHGGNLYLIGTFSSISSNPTYFTIGDTTITTINNSDDIFIAKYDSSGNVIWVKSISGSKSDIGTSIAIDMNYNVYITGYFESLSLNFDSIILYNTNSAWSDAFIAKYDSSGNVLWVKSVVGTNSDLCNDIAIDNNDNLYVTGYSFSSDIIFGTDTLINPNPGYTAYFIVKYNPAGNVLWTKSSNGLNNVSIDMQNNIYYFAGKKINKFNPNGNLIWSKQIEINNGSINQIISDSNNIYIAGCFNDDTISIGNDTLFNVSGICELMSGLLCHDVFLAKLSDSVTAVNTVGLEKPLTVYPNPTSGQVIIDANDIISVQIFSLEGKPTRTYKNRNELDMSGLPDGMYFIFVQTKTKRYYSKIIKLE